MKNEQMALLFSEATPYIQKYHGKTLVIKYGGNAMVNDDLKLAVMNDLVTLTLLGVRVVLVHGGGPAINSMLKKVGKESKFVGGLRYTDEETMDVVQQVLCGRVNKNLVATLNRLGGRALGLCGLDGALFQARLLDERFGLVGEITKVDPTPVNDALDNTYIPVVSTVAQGVDADTAYNINADTAAGAVAAALHAHKAIFLTDVDGLYKDFSDKDSLISNLTLDEVNEMLYGGEVDKGMIPKLRAAVDALTGGVFRAHIINGTTPHSLLLELLTDAGVGTVIHSTETAYEFDTHPHPLSTFAARLTENLDEVEKLQTV